jgi:hypothetical protein
MKPKYCGYFKEKKVSLFFIGQAKKENLISW